MSEYNHKEAFYDLIKKKFFLIMVLYVGGMQEILFKFVTKNLLDLNPQI